MGGPDHQGHRLDLHCLNCQELLASGQVTTGLLPLTSLVRETHHKDLNQLYLRKTTWFRRCNRSFCWMLHYKIFMSHLKFEEALHISYYSDTVASPTSHYGQPHQLALPHLAELMAESSVDTTSLRTFAFLRQSFGRHTWDFTDRTSSAAAKGRKLDQRSIVPETLLHKTTTVLCGTEPPLTITKERIPSTSIV